MADRGRPASPFTQRRRGQRRRSVVRVLVGLLVVALLAGGVYVVAFSDLLAARSVEVEGLSTLTKTEVEAAAAVPLGTPLARLDLEAVESRVRSLPRVESVEASRSWPRTVSLRVVERTAVAWISIGGQVRGVDRFGADFRSFDEPPPLTEIRVATTDPRRRQQSLEGLGSVLSIMRTENQALVDRIAFGTAESQDSLTFQLTDGRTVRWGNFEKTKEKIAVLTALLASVDASQYDVSAPEQPTTKE